MKKMALVLGVAAMMLSCVGCGEHKGTIVNEQQISNYEELEDMADELTSDVEDLYVETFKEIYGEDFEMDKLVIEDEYTVSYNGVSVSAEYVEEMAYNNMQNLW